MDAMFDKPTILDSDRLVEANTAFAVNLYHQLCAAEGNLFFSPHSISSALVMTLAGAAGPTRDQMMQALSLTSADEELHSGFSALNAKFEDTQASTPNKLFIANALWPQKGFKINRSFRNLVQKYYGVKVKTLDFAESEKAREVINEWVEGRTEEKITDLIAPGVLNNLTRLVLVNAMYFSGAWLNEFSPRQTSDDPFHLLPDGEVNVPMMHQKSSFMYTEDDLLQVLELPYAGKELSMMLLLPKEKDGLSRLEDVLTADKLHEWTENLVETEINVALPRFEITSSFRLDESLKTMGMVDAFSSEADFSLMEEKRELKIGAVFHKGFVKVNEEGTEAAAATAVVMVMKSLNFMTVNFIADHPFLFYIRHNPTGSLLFLGRLVKPV